MGEGEDEGGTRGGRGRHSSRQCVATRESTTIENQPRMSKLESQPPSAAINDHHTRRSTINIQGHQRSSYKAISTASSLFALFVIL